MNYNNCKVLVHWGEKEDHKYVARVPLKKRGKKGQKYRYFYTKEAYQAYLNGEKAKDAVGNFLDNASKQVTKTVDNAKKNAENALNDNAKSGKEYTNSFMSENSNTKTTVGDMSDVIDTAKTIVRSIINGLTGSGVMATLGKITKEYLDEQMEKEQKESESDTNSESTDNSEQENSKYIEKVQLPNGEYRYFYDQDEYNKYLARLEYQKNEPDFLKDLPKIDDNTIMNSDEHMAEINEEYDWFSSDRSMNCAYCTTAYEMRMRGYDVQAADFVEATYDGDPWSMETWYENVNMQYISPDGSSVDINQYTDPPPTSEKELGYVNTISADDALEYRASVVEKALESGNPPNSRGNLCVYWAGGGGHSMAYETDNNGKVKIRDCQTNEVYTTQELMDMGVVDVFYFRTDNLKVTENILHTLEDN